VRNHDAGRTCAECKGPGAEKGVGRLLGCSCGTAWHRSCIGLGDHAIPSGVIRCWHCAMWDLKMAVGEGIRPEVAARLHQATMVLRGEELAVSTGNAYRRRLDQARVWAAEIGLPDEALFPMGDGQGMAPEVIAGLLVWGAERWCAGTLDGLVSAIGDWHTAKPGARNPFHSEEGKRRLRAAKKLAAKNGHQGRGQAKAMDVELLRDLLTWLDLLATKRDPARAAMYERDACWLVLGFFGLFRRSELGGLRVGDIKRVPGGFAVTLRWTKTTGHAPVTVMIAGKTASGFDVAAVVERWLARRGGGSEDYLFTAWLHPRATGDWRGQGSMSNRPLDKRGEALVKQLQAHIKGAHEAGHTAYTCEGYSGHSLRRGGATAMRAAGMLPEEIQAHGRWTSECYKRYLERTAEERLDISRRL
jgi:integrase